MRAGAITEKAEVLGEAVLTKEQIDGSALYALEAAIPTTESVAVNGRRAIDKAKSYENGVRELEQYKDMPTLESEYSALVDGKMVNGVADHVVKMENKTVAVEAKYVDDWDKSLRNPSSKNGAKPWAIKEQQKMISQANKYSKAFGDVIYHTNSPELANHYTMEFMKSGLKNINFQITPRK